ncbi:hypothetical protein STPH1_2987 [Streptomyces sp. OM5714]|nr:hypothetical protein STPH1_2987 [Streptomyces sp. OM5714]
MISGLCVTASTGRTGDTSAVIHEQLTGRVDPGLLRGRHDGVDPCTTLLQGPVPGQEEADDEERSGGEEEKERQDQPLIGVDRHEPQQPERDRQTGKDTAAGESGEHGAVEDGQEAHARVAERGGVAPFQAVEPRGPRHQRVMMLGQVFSSETLARASRSAHA